MDVFHNTPSVSLHCMGGFCPDAASPSRVGPRHAGQSKAGSTQQTKMRNFAAFVQDRASYGRATLNLGVRWSYFDGLIPAQSNGVIRWKRIALSTAGPPGK